MQYVYVLDYSTPRRVTITISNEVNVAENIDGILDTFHLKASECSWMISDKALDDEEITAYNFVKDN